MIDVPQLTAEEILGRVLHRDGLMLVIDKPAGLPVHRGPKGGPNLEASFDALRFGLPRPPVLAHRLDKDTSGCLVLGRHRKATASLGLLFKHSKIAKTYWTVVEGGPTEDEGTIDMPLGRLNAERGWWQKPDPDGQKAITNWKVLGRGDGLAWLAMEPVTGRTHQLRVHFGGDGLADRRRQHLWEWPALRRADPASAFPRNRHPDLQEQGAGACRRAGAGAYAGAAQGLRLERRIERFPAKWIPARVKKRVKM
ncbi:hypothetical protein ACVWY2_006719 [Bradyrhizobium sp. JR6.1]